MAGKRWLEHHPVELSYRPDKGARSDKEHHPVELSYRLDKALRRRSAALTGSVRWLVRVGIALLMAPVASAPASSAGIGLDCEAAAVSAERDWGLPPGLLAAIGTVEAGRRSPTGSPQIWPWTVNARGQGVFLPRQADAVAYTAALLAQGVRSIDVGCFQVNLAWHPTAFASLAEAFDPAANARYAARFLLRLRSEVGDWGGAIARYHSATQELGIPYRSMVFSAWSGGLATLPAGPAAAADPVVVRTTPAARQIHVFYGAIAMPGTVHR